MGYRNEREAAMQRVDQLQDANRDLSEQLARANAEIARLHQQPLLPGENPFVPATNKKVLVAMFALATVALVPLFAAIAKSETLGVKVSLLVIPLWSAAIGAWAFARRQPIGRLVGVALVSAFTGFWALVLFFSTIWRAL